jgi:hypothetical protein
MDVAQPGADVSERFFKFLIKTIMNTIVKLGLTSLKSSDLVAKCKMIEDKMTGNALYPNPVPALADLTAAREILEQKAVSSRFGDRQAVAERRTQENTVKGMLRRLGSYVQMMSQKEEDVLSAGFEVRRESSPRGPIGRPVGLEAKRSDHLGRVMLDWDVVKGSANYLVGMTTSDPALQGTSWTQVGFTTRSFFTVDNLQPGTYYWFRVLAIGSSGESAWSDPAMVMAA